MPAPWVPDQVRDKARDRTTASDPGQGFALPGHGVGVSRNRVSGIRDLMADSGPGSMAHPALLLRA